jgi:hypothetical protein
MKNMSGSKGTSKGNGNPKTGSEILLRTYLGAMTNLSDVFALSNFFFLTSHLRFQCNWGPVPQFEILSG